MRGALFWGAILTGAGGPLLAQEFSLLVGGVSARYADSVAGSAGLLGGRLQVTRGASNGGLDASVARFVSGEWAAQLGGQGLLTRALDRRTAVGVALGGSFNQLEGGIWSATAAAGPFVARAAGPLLASLTITLGDARGVSGETFTVGTATAGVRYQGGPLRIEAASAATRADTLRFADWTAAVSWRQSTVALSASAGVRGGDLATDPWLQLGLEAAFSPRASLEAAAGSYPQDVTGFTGGRYATLGVRVAVLRRSADLARTRNAVTTRRLDQSHVRVTLPLERARSAAIAGEWNDWSPAPMSRDGSGRWTVVIAAPPGVYRYALLVDGERWTVPVGSPKARDDFGGEVGLLVVPET